MSTTWRTTVWIDGISNSGAETITVTDADEVAQSVAPAAGALRLLAPLRLSETVDADLWPAQHVSTATVQILANTAAELAMVRKGTRALVAFKVPSTAPGVGNLWDWRLPTMIQSCVLRPHASGGVVATITMVDLMVGILAQRDAGTAAWPQEDIVTRMGRVLGTFSLDWFGPAPTPLVTPNVAARAASRTTALELARLYCAEWADTDGTSGSNNTVGRPMISPTMWDTDPWDVDSAFRGWDLNRLKKTADLAGTYIDPGSQIRNVRCDIDPGMVEFPGEWTNGNDQPTQVSVSWLNAGVEDVATKTSLDYASRPVTANLSSDLVASIAAQRMAALYLPDNGTTEWVASTFRYRLSKDAAVTTIPRLGQVVVLDGIAPEHTPDGSGVYYGRLVANELTVEAGEVYQDLTLRPLVLEFASGTPSRWYFTSTAPGASPAYGSGWENTASAARGILQTSKPGSPPTPSSVQATEPAVATVNDVLIRQYVSTPFTEAGVIPYGTAITAAIRTAESNLAADHYLSLTVRVVDGAGVEQAVIYEDTTATVSASVGANNQEASTTGESRVKNVTTTQRVTVEVGWRLVVELGFKACNATTTAYTGTLYLPSTSAADHALLAGVTTALSPWLEFNRDVVP